MQPLKTSVAKVLASLWESRSADSLGAAGVAFGIVLIALGWILEGQAIGMGGAIRTMGGVLFLGGLGIVVFGDSRRRAAAIGMSKRICSRYMSETAHWSWPDRAGLGGVAIGIALVVPAVILQIIFRNGALVAGPAILIFWGGVCLLIYGRFRGRGEDQPCVPSRSEDMTKGRP